jgi:preprotein translocase subunit SecA
MRKYFTMIARIIKKIFGSRNDRLLRQYRKVVAKINTCEPAMQALTDEQLCAKTQAFQQRLSAGESLDDILPEAFAAVREASQRTLGFRHFDVQLLGGMVLHQGKIAEMRTGEGKTLMSTLPAYLNALTGEGVHLITVNDYLAERDANWMRPIYEFLGMTVGINLSGMTHDAKQAAYATDIVYGTNNEFGFDYLRDNMVFELEQRVQKTLHFAIIDEVDSILIDEARTPLIISGAAEDASDLYQKVNQLIPQLKLQNMTEGQKEEDLLEEERGDYTVDEKNRQAFLTEQGHQLIEELLAKEGILQPGDSLYDVANISIMHYLNAALRAHALYQRDVHYVVKNNEVIIVDDHTGRLMEGRRWSEGLHQAVEVKEGVSVQLENQTLATITFQNYFRLYQKLSGMTGTADTEAFELQKIYGLEVVIVPTNKPMIRDDRTDIVYMTLKEKHEAILEDIQSCVAGQQPVLVGTASIENSEKLSDMLKKAGITHAVLNAKHHKQEAGIIAAAGKPGAVTIATNMAGRGTDIVLGGSLEADWHTLGEDATEAQKAAAQEAWKKRHEAVLEAGGLHVLGTERHESRRIDNQLRGRAGRQGDAGSSQFYLSFEDNLLRIFAAERMMNLMRRLGLKDGEMIQHPWINRAVENAQRRVEGLNFDMRKQLLDYDDVANDQRKIIYQRRFDFLQSADIAETIRRIREEAVADMVSQYIPPQSVEDEWDIGGLEEKIEQEFGLKIAIQQWLDDDEKLHEENIYERVYDAIVKAYEAKEAEAGDEVMRSVERGIMLQILDSQWKDHLAAMDHLRQSIHLRGYAQKNPAQEYKRESFNMFTSMLSDLKYEVVATLSRLQIQPDSVMPQEQAPVNLSFSHAEFNGLPSEAPDETAFMPDPASDPASETDPVHPFVRSQPKIGRNDPCHCGSGKKFKQCHGKLT